MYDAAFPFPAIDPILIEIGPLAIRWYALAYIGGLIFGWWYLRRLVAANAAADRLWGGISRPTVTDVDDLLVWLTFGVVIGGRIGYVIFYNSESYLADPLEALKVWKGGMSFHGGLLGAAVSMMMFARRRGLNFWTLFDLAAAAAPLGIFLGRLANFINGELFGRPSDVPWAFYFPEGGPLPRHPSQLYEAGLEGLLLFAVLSLLVFKLRALRWPGLVTGSFGVGYGLARIFVENFREPDAQIGYLAFDMITMGMILSLPLLLIGALMILAARRGWTGKT